MTTQEIAQRYYELAKRGQIPQIQDELYAQDCVSIEPENASDLPLRVEGLAALQEKEGRYFSEQVEERFSGFCSAPVVSTYYFACASGMDVKLKGRPRMIKEQIGIFRIREGKIVEEQFFYDDFA